MNNVPPVVAVGVGSHATDTVMGIRGLSLPRKRFTIIPDTWQFAMLSFESARDTEFIFI